MKGKVIIELPFEVNRQFRITNAKIAAEVLKQLEDLEQNGSDSSSADVTEDEVLSVWADRSESPDEIARMLRHGNRQHG